MQVKSRANYFRIFAKKTMLFGRKKHGSREHKNHSIFAFFLSFPICFIQIPVMVSLFQSNPAAAIDYSLSISTSGDINISSQGGITAIEPNEINVVTNCHAGYNLTHSVSVSDNNLYLNGDSTNNAADTYFTPSDGITALNQQPNTWGYFYSSNNNLVPTDSSIFLPVPVIGTSAIIRTEQQTASDGIIDDTFQIYYGASFGSFIPVGTYQMIEDSNNQNGSLTLYLTASPTCATSLDIIYNVNAGSDVVTNSPSSSENILDTFRGLLTLSNKVPSRTGYIFKEWNTIQNGTGYGFSPGDEITIGNGEGELSGIVDLYAIWQTDSECPAKHICYHGNGADAGAMDDQATASNKYLDLIPTNYSRSGYGFAGWSTVSDITNLSATTYGPNARINTGNINNEGLKLYAKWVRSSGSLQAWSGCDTMATGSVIALRDIRDGNVYSVSKLADGNCWITENLRLDPSSANITADNTNNPTNSFLNAYSSTTSTTLQCSNDNEECTDQINYYTGNMDRTKIQSPTGNEDIYAWYSFGTMYNWYTATAGNGIYSKSSGNVDGDICPAGWRIPTGGPSGEYQALTTTLGGTGSAGAIALRAYPNNFIFSGDYNPSTAIPDGRGTQGRIWEATAYNNNKSYRMGYNASSITPINTYNKWDNFAVRCIYQGGNIPFIEVTVDFADNGIESVSFYNATYGNVLATPSNPTVNIVDNTAYTIIASAIAGYRFDSWDTNIYGVLNSNNNNPAIYTARDEAILTVESMPIPSYTTTVNFGPHVTGVSFTNAAYGTQNVASNGGTVSLHEGVEYIITATFENGYNIDAWTTSANGTVGVANNNPTTFTITDTTTISVSAEEADEVTYTLIYDAGSGTDAPATETITNYDSIHNFIITNLSPIHYGYTFIGWSETPDSNNNGTVVDYVSGDTITVTSTGTTNTKTLYPVYNQNNCPSGKICYFDNGADVNNGGRGTMANVSANSNSNANLIPSNYSRTGYGFAGWATSENTTPYGPNETITTPDLSSSGLSLYAKWIASTDNLHSWNGCNSLSVGDITALTDVRDNNVYVIAKLADNKCWTAENLRLDPSNASISNANTHNPTNLFITEASNSNSGTLLCNDNDSSCFDQIQYNTNSLNRSMTASYNTASNNASWYSYGVYYNWYTATAGNGLYDTTDNNTVTGDICPYRWHLPTGYNGEWVNLNTAVNNSSSSDIGLRRYPVNLIWSGDYNNDKRTNGYVNGRLWSATAKDNNTVYRMGFASNTVTANNSFNKWDAFAVRCVYDGDSIEYSNLTVTIPTGATNVNFANPTYGTITATTNDNIITLVKNANYTITANMSAGYEFSEWQNGQDSTIESTTTNPTVISISDNTTLTLTTSVIPTYNVSVDLDAHTNSVSFANENYPTINAVNNNGNGDGTDTITVSLRRGVEYTITGTYDSSNNYTFNSWSTTGDSTIGSTTNNTTTFVVTDAASLSLTSKQETG